MLVQCPLVQLEFNSGDRYHLSRKGGQHPWHEARGMHGKAASRILNSLATTFFVALLYQPAHHRREIDRGNLGSQFGTDEDADAFDNVIELLRRQRMDHGR